MKQPSAGCGLFLAPFDELAEPGTLAELARPAPRPGGGFDLVAEIAPGEAAIDAGPGALPENDTAR